MLRIHRDALPFRGSSHHFVGARQGDVQVSVFLFIPMYTNATLEQPSTLAARNAAPSSRPVREITGLDATECDEPANAGDM